MLPKDDAKRLEGLLENIFEEEDEDIAILFDPRLPQISGACCRYSYTDY